jgi:hypothetical protein
MLMDGMIPACIHLQAFGEEGLLLRPSMLSAEALVSPAGMFFMVNSLFKEVEVGNTAM